MSTWDSTAQHERCDGRKSSSFRWPLKNLLKRWQYSAAPAIQTSNSKGIWHMEGHSNSQSTSVTTASPSQKKNRVGWLDLQRVLHDSTSCSTSGTSAWIEKACWTFDARRTFRKLIASLSTATSRLLLHLVALKKSGAKHPPLAMKLHPFDVLDHPPPARWTEKKSMLLGKNMNNSWLLFLEVGFWHLMMPLDTEMLETMMNLPYFKRKWARSRPLVASFQNLKLFGIPEPA